MFADITGMGIFDDEFDECLSSQVICQLPGFFLVFPHQGGDQVDAGVHADVQSDLKGLDGIVTTGYPEKSVSHIPPTRMFRLRR